MAMHTPHFVVNGAEYQGRIYAPIFADLYATDHGDVFAVVGEDDDDGFIAYPIVFGAVDFEGAFRIPK